MSGSKARGKTAHRRTCPCLLPAFVALPRKTNHKIKTDVFRKCSPVPHLDLGPKELCAILRPDSTLYLPVVLSTRVIRMLGKIPNRKTPEENVEDTAPKIANV